MCYGTTTELQFTQMLTVA